MHLFILKGEGGWEKILPKEKQKIREDKVKKNIRRRSVIASKCGKVHVPDRHKPKSFC